MKLQLDDNYRITTVPLNFVLEELYTKETTDKETGEVTESQEWRFAGYYSNIKHVLRAYLSRSVMSCEATEGSKILEEIKRVEGVIDKVSNICLKEGKE